MIGMGFNPFLLLVEKGFKDCPLSELSKAFSPGEIYQSNLDKSVAKNPNAAKNFSDAVSGVETKEKTLTLDNLFKLDNAENHIESQIKAYLKDLLDYSEHPETIPKNPFETKDLKKRTPEENAEMRGEFDDKKSQLKREWEEVNGRPWPKYDHDIYSENGKLIRKAGSDYDAHHIQPLSLGGKNEANNITPLSAEVHYDKQGIHAPDSPYSKLYKLLGETES